jgi:hypothetical protein
MKWGIYIAGPGLVGWLLMREKDDSPMVYEDEVLANREAITLRGQRPYHSVSVRTYAEGDESRGAAASHPDGYT